MPISISFFLKLERNVYYINTKNDYLKANTKPKHWFDCISSIVVVVTFLVVVLRTQRDTEMESVQIRITDYNEQKRLRIEEICVWQSDTSKSRYCQSSFERNGKSSKLSQSKSVFWVK